MFPLKFTFLQTIKITKQDEVPNKYSYHYDLVLIVILMRLHITFESLCDSFFIDKTVMLLLLSVMYNQLLQLYLYCLLYKSKLRLA